MTEDTENLYKIFKFHLDSWIRTERISEDDVIVCVNSTQSRIYYYEGKNTTAFHHESAKKHLVKFKNKYPQMTYIRVNSLDSTDQTIPEKVRISLKSLFSHENNL